MLTFHHSEPLTVGVELELQLIDPSSRDLSPAAPLLMEALAAAPNAGQFKPEITCAMIELNSRVHGDITSLENDLCALRDQLVQEADRQGVAVAGGGTHPFQHWADRQIYPQERFEKVADDYGYLARRFTVFGQHIHIGCPSGDAAIYLSQQLLRYIPHFVALGASSPYHLGIDTKLECARLAAVWTFPLAGHMPALSNWREFEQYFAELQSLGIAHCIKDLYWDIRPKPEFGTVEIRIIDTPLSIQLAADLAAFAQALAKQLLERPWQPMPATLQLVHRHNLFQACRHGYEAMLIHPFSREKTELQTDLLRTLDQLLPEAQSLGTEAQLNRLIDLASARENGTRALRSHVRAGNALPDIVDLHCQQWRVS